MPKTKDTTVRLQVGGAYLAEVMKHLEASGVSDPHWTLMDNGILVYFKRSGQDSGGPLFAQETRDARQFVRDLLNPPESASL